MHLLTAEQLARVDQATIQSQQLAPHQLMQRAVDRLYDRMQALALLESPLACVVVCGSGNNGGDGLGLAAKLAHSGHKVTVWYAAIGPASADNQFMLDRLPDSVDFYRIEAGDSPLPPLPDCELLIDALFGAGLTRPIEGTWAKLVRAINELELYTIAIDLPSGVPAYGAARGATLRADRTFTIGLPKHSLLMAEHAESVGCWELIDIDLDQSAIESETAVAMYQDPMHLRPFLRSRSPFDHKGSFGHVGVVAGSHGMIGAAVLCARAALRAGSGLVSVHLPAVGYPIMQIALPEAMCIVDEHQYVVSRISDPGRFTTMAIGPGLGQNPLTANALSDLLDRVEYPLVIDADALNILAQNPDWLDRIPSGSILTPHPKEFDRLFGNHDSDFRRSETLRERARQHQLVIVLKGGYTAIASAEGQLYYNHSGNPGMGTAGMGDALTGILAGLLAQGYPATIAARLGVYLHGLAGDLAVGDCEQEALIAGDLIEYLGKAFHQLRRS